MISNAVTNSAIVVVPQAREAGGWTARFMSGSTDAGKGSTNNGRGLKSAPAVNLAGFFCYPAQKRSERIGRKFPITNLPVPRRRILCSSGAVVRCCCCALRRRSLAGPENRAAHRRSNLLSRSKGISVITKAPGLLSPPRVIGNNTRRPLKVHPKWRLDESALATNALVGIGRHIDCPQLTHSPAGFLESSRGYLRPRVRPRTSA
jgi:hypothetical protein